jgi:hypothetical protein
MFFLCCSFCGDNTLLVPNEGGKMLLGIGGGTSGLILRAQGLGDVAQPARVPVDATQLQKSAYWCRVLLHDQRRRGRIVKQKLGRP